MPKHPSAVPAYFWRGQLGHLLLTVVLLAAAWWLASSNAWPTGTFLGVRSQGWFVLALAVPIAHQVFVWLAWRSELCFGTLTDALGERAFLVYRVVFFSLFLSRPIPIIGLAFVDHDSIDLSIAVRVIVCTVLGLPAAYTGYSVVRYFGVSRASGADHFDVWYRDLPMVREGIFKYSRNSMYTYAFLGLYVIGVAAASWLAIVAAGFSHVYIWIHFFATERPDMALIYGANEQDASPKHAENVP